MKRPTTWIFAYDRFFMIIFRIYPKYSDKYALSYSLSANKNAFWSGFTLPFQSPWGSQNWCTQVLDTMLLDMLFSFILLHFSVIAKRIE